MSGHAITRNAKRRKMGSGKVKIVYSKGKHTKHGCAVCGAILQGVVNSRTSSGVHKKSKSERRPNAIFGGILCTKCRERAVIDAALIKIGDKRIEDISIKSRHFVEEAMRRVC